MAIKPNNPQPGVQAQAERPQVLGPLVAGVVVIKVFSGIKGESAFGLPTFDYTIPENAESGTQRAAGQGLSIPPGYDPVSGSNSGEGSMSYGRPPAYQSDEAAVAGDTWGDEGDPLGTSPNRSQGRAGDNDVQFTDGPLAKLPAPDAPASARTAGEQAGVAATGGEPLPSAASSPGAAMLPRAAGTRRPVRIPARMELLKAPPTAPSPHRPSSIPHRKRVTTRRNQWSIGLLTLMASPQRSGMAIF